MPPDHSSEPSSDDGATGRSDIIEIEVIDSPSHRRARRSLPSRAAPSADRTRRHVSRRQLAAVGLVAAVIGAALLVWQPWRSPTPEWRTYPVATRFPPSISARLVFDQPPGDVYQALIPETPLSTAVTRSTLVGQVFTAPGSFVRSDPWLSFSALPSHSPAEPATSSLTVRGTDATIGRTSEQTTVEWGPIERRSWTASGGGVDDRQLLAFAEAVGVVDNAPALRGSYDLAGMEPIGGVEGLHTVLTVQRELDQLPPVASVLPTVLRYSDGGDSLTLLSIPAPPDTLPFVPFVLGDGGVVDQVAVRNNPGVALTTAGGDNVVGWFEGGRLVVVAGLQSREELLSWALTTRAATDDEWGSVVDALLTDQMVTEGTAVGAGVTPNGNSWRVVASRFSNDITLCLLTVSGETCSMTSLVNWYVEGGRVAVRFSTPGQRTVARLTGPDGTVTEFDFVLVDDMRTAVAVFVAHGTTLELLPD